MTETTETTRTTGAQLFQSSQSFQSSDSPERDQTTDCREEVAEMRSDGVHVCVTGDPERVERARGVIRDALTAAGWSPADETPRRHLRLVRDDERGTA